jgi:hypothetical protein
MENSAAFPVQGGQSSRTGNAETKEGKVVDKEMWEGKAE